MDGNTEVWRGLRASRATLPGGLAEQAGSRKQWNQRRPGAQVWRLGCVLRKGNRMSREMEAEGGGRGPLPSGVFAFFPGAAEQKLNLTPAASRETGTPGAGRGRGRAAGEWKDGGPASPLLRAPGLASAAPAPAFGVSARCTPLQPTPETLTPRCSF